MGRFLTAAILLFGLETAALAEDPGLSPVSAPEATPRKKSPMAWPLWTMRAAAAGAETTLETGEALVQMDVEPRGNYLVMAVRPPKGSMNTLRIWDFKSAGAALKTPDLRARSVEALSFSAFDATLFVASLGPGAAPDYEIDRFTVDPGRKTLRKVASVFSSQHRIASLD